MPRHPRASIVACRGPGAAPGEPCGVLAYVETDGMCAGHREQLRRGEVLQPLGRRAKGCRGPSRYGRTYCGRPTVDGTLCPEHHQQRAEGRALAPLTLPGVPVPRRRPPTPPERQQLRAEDTVRLPMLTVPREMEAALAALARDWRCSVSEARRRCYRAALLRHAAGLGRREE